MTVKREKRKKRKNEDEDEEEGEEGEEEEEAWSIIPSDRLEGQGMKINELATIQVFSFSLGCKHIQPCRKR